MFIYDKYRDKDLPVWKRRAKRVGNWIIMAIVVAWFALSVASCGAAAFPAADKGVAPASEPASHGHGVYETVVPTEDGREVRCLVYSYGGSGGMSCDWEGAK